ncbi:hypothetical protein, partial [Dyadobacter sp. OTU695]|uniref:hypothetical protein n=1 Tax=Dyadobacter sp. OTU695 TaxID=3043860 RepID=UPI00313E4D9B
QQKHPLKGCFVAFGEVASVTMAAKLEAQLPCFKAYAHSGSPFFANSCRNILQDTAAIILFSIFATVTVARQESTMKLFNTIWWWRTYPSKMDK